VVTGLAGGLRLEAPGPATRPLGDKVKQALFSLMEAEREDIWEHAMLDLFAGSGAAGIEALSRGAPAAVLVEQDGRTVSVIARNLERTHLSEGARVIRRDALAFLAAGATDVAEAPFGSVVLDPPYSQTADLWAALDQLGQGAATWLDPAAVVVAKHFWKDVPPERCGSLARVRERRFGETALSVYRQGPDHDAGGR
jgi:16S rRNA (guanine966-N2)-methyltransferase